MKRFKQSPQPVKFTEDADAPVKSARAFVLKHRTGSHGAQCPVCDQLVKVYERKFNSTMAVVLLYLVRRAEESGSREWIHVPSFIKSLPLPSGSPIGNGGDWSRLRLWGLIEQRAGSRMDGSKRNGYYRVTDKGVDFACGRSRIQASVLITNQEVLGFGEGDVDVRQALGKKFDYDELMSAVMLPGSPPPAIVFGGARS